MTVQSRIMIIVALLVGLSSFVVYFFDLGVEETDVEGPVIGTVRTFSNDVKRKNKKDLTWKTLTKSYRPRAGDLFYCGDNSSLHLSLNNKSEVTLNSNSLLGLPEEAWRSERQTNKSTLFVPYGSLQMKGQAGGEWELKGHVQTIHLSSVGQESELRVNSGKAFRLALKKGTVNVAANGMLKPLKLDEAIQVAEDTVDMADSAPLTSSSSGEDLQVVVDRAMKEGKTPDKSSAEGSADLHKKLTVKEQEISEKKVALSTDSKLARPRLRLPLAEAKIFFSKEAMLSVNFVWEPQDGAQSYFFELSESDQFSNPLSSKKVEAGGTDIVLPKSGHYYWRVKAIYREGASGWSEKGDFFIEVK